MPSQSVHGGKLLRVALKPGKEKSLLRGHPWLFSGAIQSEPGESLPPGSIVSVRAHDGRYIATGYYNPHSQIRVRVVSLDEREVFGRDLLKARIGAAILRRVAISRHETNAVRLVASEVDLLPGLIIDEYGDHVVFQLLTAGMDLVRDEIIAIIEELLAPAGLVERSDDRNREKEGLSQRKELIKGREDALLVTCIENGMKLKIDLWNGHKTGFYIDQRESRRVVAQYAAKQRVLNLFCYTGGFTVACRLMGASEVISVDQSADALKLAMENCTLNGLAIEAEHFVRADVFDYLRKLDHAGEKFDIVIVDPPKFVFSKAQIDKATRGYKDLNLYAMKLLNPGGFLATFSCSGLITPHLFWQVLFGATCDVPCSLQVLKQLQQAEDHPLLLNFPESLYLKGFLARKL